MEKDSQNTILKILSIFQYIIGWILVLISSIPLLYIFIGALMVLAGFAPGRDQPEPEQALPFFVVGSIFLALGGVACLIGLIIAFCVLSCARRLKKRRKYNYCLTIAVIECIFFPFGTIIGVSTIMMLANHDVKESFS